MIEVEEAVYFLMTAERKDFVDSNNACVKSVWVRDAKEVAVAEFNDDAVSVSVTIEDDNRVFIGSDATRLRFLGKKVAEEAAKTGQPSHEEKKSSVVVDSKGS